MDKWTCLDKLALAGVESNVLGPTVSGIHHLVNRHRNSIMTQCKHITVTASVALAILCMMACHLPCDNPHAARASRDERNERLLAQIQSDVATIPDSRCVAFLFDDDIPTMDIRVQLNGVWVKPLMDGDEWRPRHPMTSDWNFMIICDSSVTSGCILDMSTGRTYPFSMDLFAADYTWYVSVSPDLHGGLLIHSSPVGR